jgi:hypothetical protein
MDEATFRLLSLGTQLLTTAGLLVAAVVGLWRYYDATEKQFRKPLWERQIDLYMAATQAASTLATTDPEREEWAAARARFWNLFWGELCVVEDDRVEAAMVKFGEYLDAFEKAPGPDRPKLREMLKECSIILAHRCRESLGVTWKADLSSLKAKYTQVEGELPPSPPQAG